MKRFAFLSVVLFSCLSFIPAAFAQAAKSATPPATQAKWVTPLKGTANVEFIQAQPKKVGDEIVSTMKVKNTSDGAIALLKIDEYWYNKKREQVGACTQRVRQPINPGQIVDVEIRCPYNADIDTNQLMFSHANGQVKPKSVKAFSGDAKK
jgi:hypothetical protein